MGNKVILLKNASTPQDPYQERFEKEGYTPIFVPLLTHTHSDKNSTIQYIQSDEFVKNIDVFIITSQRGVEMLCECLNECDEHIKDLIFQKPGYTVGPATYSILKKVGFKDVRGGENAGNGTKLSEIIHNELNGGPEKILFFTGEIRKDIIPRTLKERNYNFQERVIYKTENRHDIVENFHSIWSEIKQEPGNHWVVFFSPQGTESIVEHIKSDISIKIASIGPTTEEYLLDNDIKPSIVAPKPQANSLVDSILSHT